MKITTEDLTDYCEHMRAVVKRNAKHDDFHVFIRSDMLEELMRRANVVRVPAKTREIVG